MLALYLLVSVLAFYCAWQTSHDRSAWLVIAIMLVVIAGVRMAQTGEWLDEALQQWVRAIGWYDYRRPVQVAGIAIAILLLLAGAASVRATTRMIAWPGRCAAVALFLLLVLAAVRGSSLHWTDAALELDFAGVIVSHMLQAILLAAVGVSAVWQIVGQSFARAKTMADDIS